MSILKNQAAPMTSDFEDLLKLFNANAVRYLIVGGHAVMLYTEPRYTKDLDVWIEASKDNASRVWRALAEFGAPLAGLSPDDFAHEGFFYQLGLPPSRIDVLMSIDGLRFEEAWPERRESELGKQKAWFIGRAALIRNKRASGRHIDLHDADLLDRTSD
jgi:hypothetical protein